jgi:hypothetical protein
LEGPKDRRAAAMAYILTIEVKSLDSFFENLDSRNVTILSYPQGRPEKRLEPELQRVANKIANKLNKATQRKVKHHHGEVNSATLVLRALQKDPGRIYRGKDIKSVLMLHGFAGSTYAGSIRTLVHAGMLIKSEHGGWLLTDRGKDWPDAISVPWSNFRKS